MTAPVFVADPDDLASALVGGTVRLDGAEGRHAAAVVRVGAGDAVDLVDGRGRRARGIVEEVDGRSAIVIRVHSVRDDPDPGLRLTVVQALPKGDRGELAVELLTEVGVDAIVPWAAAHCIAQWRGERVDRGLRKWTDAAHAAGKQSRRARFPAVAGLASTEDVVGRIASASLALVLDEEADAPLAAVPLPSTGEVVVIVGPEGGLAASERAEFAAAGAHAVRLGPTVLRTSTAGMAAAAVILARTGQWSAPATHPSVEG